MRFLSIETSCDETGSAVVEINKSNPVKILSNVTASSVALHNATGGIIPETAAREQVKWIIPVIIQSLLLSEKEESKDSKTDFIQAQKILKHKIDSIAVIFGPGLIGSLLVGVETVKTLSYVLEKPVIPVNHLLGHIYANFIQNTKYQALNTIEFPFIGLIVSGGHTDLLLFKSHNRYKWLGGTRDDAAGEALDKIGRLLGLSYPAGPEIEKRSRLVKMGRFSFKSPMIGTKDFDFSFSGLKTEVFRFIQKNSRHLRGVPDTPPRNRHTSQVTRRGSWDGGGIDENFKNKICFAVQKAIIDVLVEKTIRAAEKYNTKSILLGGGVAANETLRDKFKLEVKSLQLKVKFFAPAKNSCTDNAAMIGAYAAFHPKPIHWSKLHANPELYFK